MNTSTSTTHGHPRVAALVAGLIGFAAQFGQPAALLAQDAAVVSAVEAERWSRVAARLQLGADPCEADPVDRMLRGHASLLVNDSNEAVDLFYGCRSTVEASEAAESAWLAWTEGFAEDRPSLAVAHYLLGDARARRGRLGEAARAFDRAIALEPGHAGAHNARGVVRWLLFEAGMGPSEYELSAVADLEIAAEQGLADPWASRGVIALRDGSATDFARRMFERALHADGDYWMAVNGQAVTAAAEGDAAEYTRILTELGERGGSTPFTALNDGSVRLAEGDLGGARGANNFSLAANFAFKAPLGNEISGGIDFRWRGGVFLTVADGVNLRVHEDGEAPGVVGTWFALNYPGQGRSDTR